MAEFIRRCEEFLVEEFSPLDSQWSNEDFLSLSANGLQKGLFFLGIIRDRSSLTEGSNSAIRGPSILSDKSTYLGRSEGLYSKGNIVQSIA